jgi:hypothetical protein
MEQLKQLGALHEQNVLSDEEFERVMARLLGSSLIDTGSPDNRFLFEAGPDVMCWGLLGVRFSVARQAWQPGRSFFMSVQSGGAVIELVASLLRRPCCVWIG